jgi:hypothetical protein
MSLFNGTDSYDPRIALIAQGIGSLPFDFRSITYFTVKNGELTPYPNSTQTYTIPAVNSLALGFNVTNQNSFFMHYFRFKNGHGVLFCRCVPGHTLGPVWNMVSNQSATIPGTYTLVHWNILLEFVIFALQTTQFDQQQHNSVVAINLLFFGNFTKNNGVTVVASSCGQNVPFVSLCFNP